MKDYYIPKLKLELREIIHQMKGYKKSMLSKWSKDKLYAVYFKIRNEEGVL